MLTELVMTVGTTSWASIATTTAALYRRRLHTDPLTGLGNREALYARTRRVREGLVGLVMVDLDGFKAINDTHGHDFGNKVLATVASRLAEATRAGEFAVRLHGDEFAVWLGHQPHADAAERRADEIATALAEPHWIDGHRLHVLGSVGLALGPASSATSDLLGQADEHMYQVKAASKAAHRVTVLNPGCPRRRRDNHTPGGEAA